MHVLAAVPDVAKDGIPRAFTPTLDLALDLEPFAERGHELFAGAQQRLVGAAFNLTRLRGWKPFREARAPAWQHRLVSIGEMWCAR